MKRKYFKDYDTVLAKGGWGKMYYYFDDLERHDSAYLLNYLIDTQPVPEAVFPDDPDYLRYSNGFIAEKLGDTWTKHIIKEALDDLAKHNYISILKTKAANLNSRYIKLNYEKLAAALGIEDLDDIDSMRNA